MRLDIERFLPAQMIALLVWYLQLARTWRGAAWCALILIGISQLLLLPRVLDEALLIGRSSAFQFWRANTLYASFSLLLLILLQRFCFFLFA